MNEEKLLSHYNSLKEKHAKLDNEITQNYNSYSDDIEINKLKSEKLYIKEQMYNIETQLGMANGKKILHGNN